MNHRLSFLLEASEILSVKTLYSAIIHNEFWFEKFSSTIYILIESLIVIIPELSPAILWNLLKRN